MTQPPCSLPSSHGGCRFFEKLFEIEDDYEEYRIRLVPEGALRQILNWMYSRKIDLTEDNVAEILRTAHYIDCSQVVKMTSDYLGTKIDPENAVGFWRFAAIYQVWSLAHFNTSSAGKSHLARKKTQPEANNFID